MTQLLQEEKNNLSIYFVGRGKHLELIKKNGLILNTKEEGILKCIPTMATDDFEKLPMLDICYICVKQYDLENVLHNLFNKIGENTKVIPLLNGIDIYDRIRKILKKGVVFPACAYVGTHIKEHGVVEQNGGACTIIFGQDPENKDINVNDICELMEKAKIKYNYSPKYLEEIWSKYIFIASYGLVKALDIGG